MNPYESPKTAARAAPGRLSGRMIVAGLWAAGESHKAVGYYLVFTLAILPLILFFHSSATSRLDFIASVVSTGVAWTTLNFFAALVLRAAAATWHQKFIASGCPTELIRLDQQIYAAALRGKRG